MTQNPWQSLVLLGTQRVDAFGPGNALRNRKLHAGMVRRGEFASEGVELVAHFAVLVGRHARGITNLLIYDATHMLGIIIGRTELIHALGVQNTHVLLFFHAPTFDHIIRVSAFARLCLFLEKLELRIISDSFIELFLVIKEDHLRSITNTLKLFFGL